jgi:hypothetical protein
MRVANPLGALDNEIFSNHNLKINCDPEKKSKIAIQIQRNYIGKRLRGWLAFNSHRWGH